MTKYFDRGEIFRLTATRKANRQLTMVFTHRKITDKIILLSIQSMFLAIFKGIQYGVGCSLGLEKFVRFVHLGDNLHPNHGCANSDFMNAFSTNFRENIISITHKTLPEISATIIN